MSIMLLLLCTSMPWTVPSAIEVIETEGILCFTDGSSVYQFYEDGSFLLEPAGMSGRSIEGNWVMPDLGQFEITGTWGWYNGISAINDKRRMVISVTVLSEETIESDLLWSGNGAQLWDVYFTIEEIMPLLQL